MRLLDAATLPADGTARVRGIYEDGFPEELRSPYESLFADHVLACLDDGTDDRTDDRTDDGADEGARVAGLLVLRDLPSTGWLFLRYFVVGMRGRGLGSRMWAAMVAAFPDVERIVLDVEDPDEPGLEAAEVDERRRRIAFYERLDVDLLPVQAYRPPHDDAEPALRLLVWQRERRALDDAEVRRVVLAAYRDRYGLDEDHPTVRATLAASGLNGLSA